MNALVRETIYDFVVRLPRPGAILELGAGDGQMLADLSGVLPRASFTAVDVSPVLGAALRGRFSGAEGVAVIEQDLSAHEWPAVSGRFDVIYSVQTAHDLGGRDALERLYATAAARLLPGGVIVNADFIEPMPHDDPERPRRFAPAEHVALLRATGLRDARHVATRGSLGLMIGFRSET